MGGIQRPLALLTTCAYPLFNSTNTLRTFGRETGNGSSPSSRLAAERFRESIHILHPILEEAGLGFGNLGAFARLAGAGFAGLAVAIGGSLLIGLAKIGDEADKAKRRLDPYRRWQAINAALAGGGGGGGDWILSSGAWNDSGVWDDASMWKDAA